MKEPMYLTVAQSCCSTRITFLNVLSILFWRGVKVLKQSPYLECSTANTLLVAYVGNTN